jgi:hypothetical protein
MEGISWLVLCTEYNLEHKMKKNKSNLAYSTHGYVRTAHKILVRKPGGTRSRDLPSRRWER